MVRRNPAMDGENAGRKASPPMRSFWRWRLKALSRLMPALPQSPEAEHLARNLERFGHSPITGIHLWFDREITDLDHAILLDRTIQWLFHKSRLQPEKRRGAQGSYVELVVSASKSLVEMQRQEIIDLAVRELADFFPWSHRRS